MSTQQVKEQIQKIPQLKDFKWIGNKENYAILPVDARHFKDENKREFKLFEPYSIFIAHMYEGEVEKEFFYIIISRNGLVREFRKHDFCQVEFNKIYVSGKTAKEVAMNLQEKLDNGYSFV